MKENILNIETIHEYNCCLGDKTLHPLVSVIDLSEANLEQCTIKFDFYIFCQIPQMEILNNDAISETVLSLIDADDNCTDANIF